MTVTTTWSTPTTLPKNTSSAARVLFVNQSSGPQAASVDELVAAFPSFDVRAIKPNDLSDQVHKAVEANAVVVAVAGGDGTLSSAAQALRGSRTALLPVPAGTRNHFAHDVGVHDIDLAVSAAHLASPIKVDVGAVNGQAFINNASLGTYTRVVRKREQYEKRWRKPVANIAALFSELRHGHRLSVDLDGEKRLVWAVFVGNGTYGDGLRDVTTRDSLREGCLDVWVVRARGRFSRLRVLAAVVAGRLETSTMIERSQVASLEVDPRKHHIDVACDGEVFSLKAPLRFSVDRGALQVLVPPQVDDESDNDG